MQEPARQACSHWASLGRPATRPGTSTLRRSRKVWTSFQLTCSTGLAESSLKVARVVAHHRLPQGLGASGVRQPVAPGQGDLVLGFVVGSIHLVGRRAHLEGAGGDPAAALDDGGGSSIHFKFGPETELVRTMAYGPNWNGYTQRGQTRIEQILGIPPSPMGERPGWRHFSGDEHSADRKHAGSGHRITWLCAGRFGPSQTQSAQKLPAAPLAQAHRLRMSPSQFAPIAADGLEMPVYKP